MEEVELWQRVLAQNDGRALGRIYELHGPRVFRHAARLASNRQDAEDAVAVAFLELWRRRATVRLVDGSPLPWLLSTTTNASRNLRRSAARYNKLLSSLPRQADAAAADELAFGDNDARALLAPLNAVDQQLATLVYLEGYSSNEAAEAIGLSPGAARTRLSRARSKLRRAHQPSFAVQEDTP